LLAACGDSDNPAGPVALDENLVGTWALDSTDMLDVMILGFENLLRDAGAGQDRIDEFIVYMRTLAEERPDLFSPILTIRFNADGAYTDDHGGSGTWRVEGNILITVGTGGVERIKYFVAGDDLTLIFPLLDSLRDSADFNNEDFTLFREIFDADTNVRFFFKRK